MNLLPERYRERSLGRARSGRVAAATIAILGLTAIVATHARLSTKSASSRLVAAQARANDALEIESQASHLEQEKASLEKFVERYRNAEVSLPMGDIVATIANMLPQSVTLEELALDLVKSETGRKLTGRLAGFSETDEEIARLVDDLAATQPFEDVGMDFSRSRTVRGRQAREFRIGFSIDVDAPWRLQRGVASVGELQ
ncbi:MAG: hypothetical protein QGH76_08535 [Phycisphaerales bacterium]|jgi:hypothetical protein|nr:hypothetical protein [Phycisphaerales bacterium]